MIPYHNTIWIINQTMTLLIAIFSIFSFYYGIKNIRLNYIIRDNYPTIRHVLPTLLSFIGIILFSWVLLCGFFNIQFLDHTLPSTTIINVFILTNIIVIAAEKRIKYYNSLRLVEILNESRGINGCKE